jgi:hypothetical protein
MNETYLHFYAYKNNFLTPSMSEHMNSSKTSPFEFGNSFVAHPGWK